MIAKATSISHGATAIRYSVNKERADIVKVNLLPDDISPEAIHQRMMLTQKKFADQIRRGRPLDNKVIRFELSPTEEETKGWSMADWERLANEFISVFDSIDLSKWTKRASSKHTNIQGSQYVVALHRDSRSGILHLHIDANRVDNEGRTNDDHRIGLRAVMAANIINQRRGWKQLEEICTSRKKMLSDQCLAVLKKMNEFSWSEYESQLEKAGHEVKIKRDSLGIVRGYTFKIGNSIYKSSELGTGRNLTPSKIESTWAKLHVQKDSKIEPAKLRSKKDNNVNPKPRVWQENKTQHGEKVLPSVIHYDISTDNHRSYHISIPEDANNIIMQECSLEGAHPLATIEEIQKTALLLFAEYIDAATSIAESSGGGNTSDLKWGRDKDEDDKEWARRCAKTANRMCRQRRGLRR